VLLAEKIILPCVRLAFVLALGVAPIISFQLQETGTHEARSPIGIIESRII